MQHATFNIHLGQLQAAGFGNAQAVAEHEQEQTAIARGVAVAGGRGKELVHFLRGEVFAVLHHFVSCCPSALQGKPAFCGAWPGSHWTKFLLLSNG